MGVIVGYPWRSDNNPQYNRITSASWKTIIQKKMKKRDFLLLIVTFAIGLVIGAVLMLYYENHKNDDGKSMVAWAVNEPIDQLEKKVWESGDADAYYKLSLSFIDGGHTAYYVFWPLYMANKYGDVKACWDVYFFLEDTYEANYGDSALYIMDKTTRQLALKYLKMGAEKNDSVCINTINELKGKKYPNDWFTE